MTTPRYAYLGPSGTFTEAALIAMAGDQEIEALPAVDVPTALAMVRDGSADYAVVAMENTVEGGVTATLDALAEGEPLEIYGETVMPIAFDLAVREGVGLSDIASIGAHPHAWAQVRRWVSDVIPGTTFVPAASNAAAARQLADQDFESLAFDAALVPPGVAPRYGLAVAADAVADSVNAATRFVKVGPPGGFVAPTGADKTTLVVHLPNDQSGALLRMLEQFAVRGVNLSRIESRPISDRPGEYSFSMDALGHIQEARVAEAVVGLKRTCPVVLFLGSYPAAHGDVTPVIAGTSDLEFEAANEWVRTLRER